MNTIAAAARTLAKARAAQAEAIAGAKAAALEARANGMFEADIAELLGVNRGTVRKWLGK